jgi:hypothetical protein
VDALHVLRRRFGKLHLIFLGEAGVAVTFGAGLRKVEFEHGRGRVFRRQNIVCAVAIHATRRTGRAALVAGAMNARGVIASLLLMTRRAIGRERLDVVIGMFRGEVGVAA